MSEKKTDPTLSEQLRQLDELIAWFDQDDFELDEALTKFEDGMKLTSEIETRLTTLENKITVLRQRFDDGGEKNA